PLAPEDAATPESDVLAAALRQPPEAAPAGKSAVAAHTRMAQPNEPTRPTPPAPSKSSAPDFSGLSPQMAASLAKLAGVPWPPKPDGSSKKDEEPKEESVVAAPHCSKEILSK
ncbi:MAG: hypothetical protein V3R17_05150, partial [Hyphomicrobium sp.]